MEALCGALGMGIPELHRRPIRSRTIAEFWGVRWNTTVGPWRRASVYAPLARRGSPRLGVLCTFVASAALHAWITWLVVPGWLLVPVTAFFLVQGLLVVVEAKLRVRAWRRPLAHAWTVTAMGVTSPLFTEPMMRVLFSAALVLLLVSQSSIARAGGPLGVQGAPIQTSDYTVDLFHGPVLAGARVTALGGANSALATGAEAMSTNAAAPAVRTPHSDSKTDWDFTVGLTRPSALEGTDFDNNGARGFSYGNFFFATVGGQIQIGRLGIGATLDAQQYSLGQPAGVTSVTVDAAPLKSLLLRYGTGRLLGSYALFDHQLYVGGGMRAAILGLVGTVDEAGTEKERELLTITGLGVEGGILWAPKDARVRLGFTARSPVPGKAAPGRVQADAAGDVKVGNMFLPNRIVLPWEFEFGVATQLGPRPLNVGFTEPASLPEEEVQAELREREPVSAAQARILRRRYNVVPRRKLLISASLLVTGATDNAVGFESFLGQTVDRSGQRVSLTPRLGLEGEIIPSWTQVRAGSYLEPTRFSQSSPRVHGTFGFDQKLFAWSVFGLFDEPQYFRVGGVLDAARAYLGFGLTAGIWK